VSAWTVRSLPVHAGEPSHDGTSCYRSPAANLAAVGDARVAKFIEVILDNTTQQVTVNADKIVKFWRPEKYNYTIIELEGGSSLTVKEGPIDIWNQTVG
jgi:hypothetical protein